MIRIIILTLLISFSPGLIAKSFNGSIGHGNDMYGVFEDIAGNDFKLLAKDISQGIDSSSIQGSFSQRFLEKFPDFKPGYAGHRVLGHWGFEGAIPFNDEPWKSALQKYPRAEVAKIWQQFVEDITQKTMSTTGLDYKAAKGLSGILYNTHILGDWSTTITDPLANPEFIRQDIIKNLHRLFGNNSEFVRGIAHEFSIIPCNSNPVVCSEKTLDILRKAPIGGQLFNVYGAKLNEAGLHQKVFLEQGLERMSSKPSSFKDIDDLAKTKGLRATPGVLSPDGKLITAIRTGAGTGIVVFAIESGVAGYQFINGNTFKPEFERKITDAAIKGTAVGGGVAVAVLLGSNPAGWVISGVAIGADIITNVALNSWHKQQDDHYLNLQDLQAIGIEFDQSIPLNAEHWDPSIPLNAGNWK